MLRCATLAAGPSILVAPVLEEGAQQVQVQLPGGGLWYDSESGTLIDSGEHAALPRGGHAALPGGVETQWLACCSSYIRELAKRGHQGGLRPVERHDAAPSTTHPWARPGTHPACATSWPS